MGGGWYVRILGSMRGGLIFSFLTFLHSERGSCRLIMWHNLFRCDVDGIDVD